MANNAIREVLPRDGMLHRETLVGPILCKPKLLPLKSLTLARMEDEQRDAQIKFAKEQSSVERLAESVLYESIAAATSGDGPFLGLDSESNAAQRTGGEVAAVPKSKPQNADVLKLDFNSPDNDQDAVEDEYD